jgi:transposase-like protein
MPGGGIDALPTLWLTDRDEGRDHPARRPALPLPSMRAALHSTLDLCVLPSRFPDEVIALAIRLSYAEVSEWLAERGVLVDQSTIYRWVQRYLPLFGDVARMYRDPVGPDWRVDETYARIRGRWHDIYRAIDGRGQIVDAYMSPTRDAVAARRFFEHCRRFFER